MKLLSLKTWIATVALAASMTSAVAQEASRAKGQAEISAEAQVFSDWRVACDEAGSCRMVQTIVQPSTRRLILQLKVFAGEDPTLLLSFPLGILLSPGWQYQIDGNRKAVLPFEICNSEGCHAGVKLTPQLLKAMKRGSDMKITFFDAAREDVMPVISLIGFTKAWEALQ
ncbi:invasion associated locus B family protein (plasmid) [Aquicoccus sp. G2-2]|uniref:invasion associated locus B family protein n=1 Tax=Aquicoccus sp. G2-2 TaxID=3092120 RepID=UPI003671DAE5